MHQTRACRRPVLELWIAALMFLFFFGPIQAEAQTDLVEGWQEDLRGLEAADDRDLLRSRDTIARIRRGIQRWGDLHPSFPVGLDPAPPKPWDTEDIRLQAGALGKAVARILEKTAGAPFSLVPVTLLVRGEYEEEDFVGPLFTETVTRTQITEKGIRAIDPASRMSVTRAINLVASVNQQSVDPVGLADISNYHESFRFRGVEPTGGGNPSTPVNVENIPVSGRPGGGAGIYDLDNFRSLSMYKGGIPADKALGLTNIGGKIDMEVRRASGKIGLDLKQALGSHNFRRHFLRIESAELPGGFGGFLSFSDTHADKWKGSGASDRNNLMAGLTRTLGGKLKLEAFSIYNQSAGNAYRPLEYGQAASPDRHSTADYSEDPSDYFYYAYNKNDFEDISVFGSVSYAVGDKAEVVAKPFFWKDSGYYRETVTRKNGSNRIRQWDIDHSMKGVLVQYSQTLKAVRFSAGYSYLEQGRPGPPTSWKLYAVSPDGPAFEQWQVLSNPSKHRQHAPFVSGSATAGRVHVEGGAKFVHYTMPEITTYTTGGLGDLSYEEALGLDLPVEEGASARSRRFTVALPNLGMSLILNRSLSAYASYGRNFAMSVSLYPFFISQKSSFLAEGITLQDLWDRQELETADNFDFGLRYITKTLYVVPTLYYARHKNKTATYYDGSLGASFPSSAFSATACGFELEAGAMPLDNLTIYASFSHNRFYFTEDMHGPSGADVAVDGNQVPDAPRYLVKGVAGWRIGNFTISPAVRFTSSRYGDILQEEQIDGATLFDLDVSYRTSLSRIKNFDVSFAVNNLSDKRYISIINASDYATLGSSYQAGAPRTFQGSVAVEF